MTNDFLPVNVCWWTISPGGPFSSCQPFHHIPWFPSVRRGLRVFFFFHPAWMRSPLHHQKIKGYDEKLDNILRWDCFVSCYLQGRSLGLSDNIKCYFQGAVWLSETCAYLLSYRESLSVKLQQTPAKDGYKGETTSLESGCLATSQREQGSSPCSQLMFYRLHTHINTVCFSLDMTDWLID